MSEGLSKYDEFSEFVKSMESLYKFTEEEFLTFDRIVPMRLNKDSMNTVSTKLYFILLTTCGQIDSVTKQIVKNIKCYNIKDEKHTQLHKLRQVGKNVLPEMRAIVRSTALELKPFSKSKTPKWWLSYNLTKHTLPNGLKFANITNTINALAALRLLLNMHTLSYVNYEKILDEEHWNHDKHPLNLGNGYDVWPYYRTSLFDIPSQFGKTS